MKIHAFTLGLIAFSSSPCPHWCLFSIHIVLLDPNNCILASSVSLFIYFEIQIENVFLKKCLAMTWPEFIPEAMHRSP